MTKDPIVEDVHGIREEISKEAGDDLDRILAAAKERQRTSEKDHVVVRLPPKHVALTRKVS